MSQERVLKTLMGLGLSETDAQVYIFLLTNGPQNAKDIARALKKYRRKVYRSLQSLQNKKIVNATLKRPAQFSASPFDEALNLLIQAHLEEAQYVEQNREEILSQWNSLMAEKSVTG